MKARNGQIDFSEMPPYKLGRHWNTIQSYLILGIEDDIGELSEELKMFMEICELLIDERMFAKDDIGSKALDVRYTRDH